MAGSELVVLYVCGSIALLGYARWVYLVLRLRTLAAVTPRRVVMLILPPLCIVLVVAALRVLAAHDVRDDPRYLFMYTALGGAWLVAASRVWSPCGVSPRDDALERGNRAALCTCGAWLIAAACCYAGGNIGDGPGWWVVLFASGLATGALLLAWLLLVLSTDVIELLTVERDTATGIRVGALLLAAGLVFGRGVAGDWVSPAATLNDFARAATPVLFGLASEILLLLALRPSPQRPALPLLTAGVLPGMAYLLAAGLYVAALGPPA